MREVQVEQSFPGSVHEAERCWYDTGRWQHWVDGFDRIVEVSADWPQAGAVVIWQSGPAGRGRVTERVIAHRPLEGQTLEVQDDSISARQRVAFTPVDDHVQVELSLEYEIARRSVVTSLIDLLFIRRVMATSLAGTVARFGTELAASAAGRPAG